MKSVIYSENFEATSCCDGILLSLYSACRRADCFGPVSRKQLQGADGSVTRIIPDSWQQLVLV